MSQAGSLGQSGSIGPTVPIDFVCDVGSATASANVLNVFGTGGSTTTGTGNTITITTMSSSFTWNLVTSVSPTNPIQIVAENAYICTGSSLVTFILPLAPSIGDTFLVLSLTSRFEITENGFQVIQIGVNKSTAGSGNATSNVSGDFIELVYVGSNIFFSFSPQGTINLS